MPASPQRLALTLALLSTSCLSPVAFAKAALLSTASTDSLTLNGNDTLTLTPSGSLTSTQVAVTLKDDTRGSGVVIDNAGSLISTGGRAIDTSGSTRGERNYSIINRSGATIRQASSHTNRVRQETHLVVLFPCTGFSHEFCCCVQQGLAIRCAAALAP